MNRIIIPVMVLAIGFVAVSAIQYRQAVWEANLPRQSAVTLRAIEEPSGEPGAEPGVSPGNPGAAPGGEPGVSTPEEPPPMRSEDRTIALPADTISLVWLTCLGVPIGEDLPEPAFRPDQLAAYRCDPAGIYQFELAVGGDQPGTRVEGLTWDYHILGGGLSDLLMESYPPQLGNPRETLTAQGPFVVFQVHPKFGQPAQLEVTATDPENPARQWKKTYLLRQTDFDSANVESVPGELLIGLAHPAPLADPSVQAFLTAHELIGVETLLGDGVLHVRDAQSPPRDPFDLHWRVIGDPLVQYAEPNYIAHTMGVE